MICFIHTHIYFVQFTTSQPCPLYIPINVGFIHSKYEYCGLYSSLAFNNLAVTHTVSFN